MPLNVPSFGRSAAIAAAPKAMAVLSVKADKIMCAIASNFPPHDQSLIVSERPAFFGSPASAIREDRTFPILPARWPQSSGLVRKRCEWQLSIPGSVAGSGAVRPVYLSVHRQRCYFL